MKTACNVTDLPEAMNDIERERAVYANKVYCKACDENGIKICSWENFSAWKEYVDGNIGEEQLVEKAEEELKTFSDTFKKYTVPKEEDLSASKQKEMEQSRVKQANKTYKRLCVESGLNLCFFKDFSSWKDYVHGSLSEAEFVEKAREEAKKMADEA